MNYDKIKQYANDYAVPIMRNQTAEIMASFVKENNPDHILEIGTAIGYSGIIMLENSKADLITIEHNKSYIRKAKEHFKNHNLLKRVKILDGDCLVVLANMANNEEFLNHFDLIFLDGPKAQYSNMLELLILLLKKKPQMMLLIYIELRFIT